MPHCIIEYSNDLEIAKNLSNIIQVTHTAIVESCLFEISSIKIRAIAIENYLVGGKISPFIHTTVRILEGRSDEKKQKLSKAVFDAIDNSNHSIGSITVDIIDINPNCYSRKQQ